MIKKLKLACGALVILVLTFCFVSFFTLAALSKLYIKLSGPGLPDAPVGFQALVLQFGTGDFSTFVDEQIAIAEIVLLGGGLMVSAVVAWLASPMAEQPAQNTFRPLFLMGSLTWLSAVGWYIRNFLEILPVEQIVAVDLLNFSIEIATIIMITVLLSVELLILLFKLLKSKKTDRSSSSTVDPHSIRPVVFLFLLGVDLSAAFIPLHMKKLYQPLWNLPKDVVLGLPISAMFLCVGITIIVSGIWVDRRSWHEPLLVGLGLTAGGMLYAWLAPTAMHFIIAMGLAGLGYGLALMAPQGFVMVHTDDKNKAQGLAYLFAGIYAGSICGTAIGAMLAERIGYTPVFLLSVLMISLAFAYTWIALRGVFKQRGFYERRVGRRYLWKSMTEASRNMAPATVTAKHYWNFLSNRYVLSLIFLSSLPSAVAVIGLLNYFVPVYLDHLGVPQGVIGSVLVLYGLCMVYVAPFISKYIDLSHDKRLFVIIGCVLGGCAFLCFQLFTGLIATVTAVLLLGLSSCFVLASQTTYALTLDVTQQLGQGRAIGIFRASSRVGQMIGPMLFGWLMMSYHINQGLMYFGLAYLTTAALFFLLTCKSLYLLREK